MSRHRRTTSPTRSRRAIALLMTLLMLAALAIIVAQMQIGTNVAYMQVARQVRERACRRALDSVPGLAGQMLAEAARDLAVDTLNDEWTKPKCFDIGDVHVEITIEDCERWFDLKGLLEENPDVLKTNKQTFVDFAVECGLAQDVAMRLAEAIIQEAEARRVEDAAFVAQLPTADGQPAPNVKTLVPVWLEDLFGLPQLSDDDRWAIREASASRQDPTTGETITARLLDELTIWRYNQVNINTASREVLLHAVADLAGKPDAVDDIIARRVDTPFSHVAQIGNVESLTREEAQKVSRQVRLNSVRFRVTATATLINKKPTDPLGGKVTMVLILERGGSNRFTTHWRHVSI